MLKPAWPKIDTDGKWQNRLRQSGKLGKMVKRLNRKGGNGENIKTDRAENACERYNGKTNKHDGMVKLAKW